MEALAFGVGAVLPGEAGFTKAIPARREARGFGCREQSPLAAERVSWKEPMTHVLMEASNIAIAFG